MPTLSEIRTGIVTNLGTISGLRTSAYVPDEPKPPIAIIFPENVSFDTAFGRGLDTYAFTIQLIVSKISDRNAQSNLDGYCNPSGASSVKAAVESDKTLGGLVQDLRVTEARDYRAATINENTYLTVTFAVTVYA
jgi:hypothetical protein